MAFGVKQEDKKTFCKKCGAELKMKVPDELFSFCPYCGAPLTEVAYNVFKEKEKLIKLKTLEEIELILETPTDLKNLVKIIDKISKK